MHMSMYTSMFMYICVVNHNTTRSGVRLVSSDRNRTPTSSTIFKPTAPTPPQPRTVLPWNQAPRARDPGGYNMLAGCASVAVGACADGCDGATGGGAIEQGVGTITAPPAGTTVAPGGTTAGAPPS